MKPYKLLLGTAFLLFFGSQSFSESPSLTVPSEKQSQFAKIDYQAIDKYRHQQIKYITFHHEGFSDGKRKHFEQRRRDRERQDILQRTINIHNDHRTRKNPSIGMIAYNYIVDKSGNIAKGRPIAFAPGTFSKHPRTS